MTPFREPFGGGKESTRGIIGPKTVAFRIIWRSFSELFGVLSGDSFVTLA
jgi:hypothetical protein